MSFFGNGVLAVTKRVPKLNCLISTAADDLSVIGTERDRQDIVCVPDETTGCFSRVEIPEPEGLVPRGRESVLTVRGDDNVLNKMIMALQINHHIGNQSTLRAFFGYP